jgi:hypothetical protein
MVPAFYLYMPAGFYVLVRSFRIPVADVTFPVACFMEKRGQPIKRTTFALFCQLLCPARGYSFALSIETDNK